MCTSTSIRMQLTYKWSLKGGITTTYSSLMSSIMHDVDQEAKQLPPQMVAGQQGIFPQIYIFATTSPTMPPSCSTPFQTQHLPISVPTCDLIWCAVWGAIGARGPSFPPPSVVQLYCLFISPRRRIECCQVNPCCPVPAWKCLWAKVQRAYPASAIQPQYPFHTN